MSSPAIREFVHAQNTTSVAFTVAAQVGDVVVVMVFCYSATTHATIDDSETNVYTEEVFIDSTGESFTMLTAPVTDAGTLTISVTASGSSPSIIAYLVAGPCVIGESAAIELASATPVEVQVEAFAEATLICGWALATSHQFLSFTGGLATDINNSTWQYAAGSVVDQPTGVYDIGANVGVTGGHSMVLGIVIESPSAGASGGCRLISGGLIR